MKHLFLALAVIFTATFAHASVKLTVQPTYSYTDHKQVEPLLGLAVYQKMGMAAYNGWIGTGKSWFEGSDVAPSSDARWYSMKHSAEFYFKRLTVAPGFQVAWNNQGTFEATKQEFIFVKLGYQIF